MGIRLSLINTYFHTQKPPLPSLGETDASLVDPTFFWNPLLRPALLEVLGEKVPAWMTAASL